MRFLFLFLITFFLIESISVSAKAKADTIDFWHIYYNHKIIARFNGNLENRVVTIEKSKIKPNDILSVDYGNDSPGDDIIGVYVKAGFLKKTKLIEGKANFSLMNKLDIPVVKILEILKSSNQKTIDLYYYDLPRFDHFIFTLKLK